MNYITKGGDELQYFNNLKAYRILTEDSCWGKGQSINFGSVANGKVAFEYVVNKVDIIPPCEAHNGLHYPLVTYPELAELVKMACLSHDELFLYGVKKNQGCYGASSKVAKLYAFTYPTLKFMISRKS